MKEELLFYLLTVKCVLEIDEVPGGIRLLTNYLYSDGSNVDVFISQREDGKFEFTDFSSTVFLLDENMINTDDLGAISELITDEPLEIQINRFANLCSITSHRDN